MERGRPFIERVHSSRNTNMIAHSGWKFTNTVTRTCTRVHTHTCRPIRVDCLRPWKPARTHEYTNIHTRTRKLTHSLNHWAFNLLSIHTHTQINALYLTHTHTNAHHTHTHTHAKLQAFPSTSIHNVPPLSPSSKSHPSARTPHTCDSHTVP